MSFPKELNYASNKPMASTGKPEILRFKADNSSYPQSGTVRIEIPTGRRGMHLYPLQSYIEGQITVSATASDTAGQIYLDQSIYSIVRRLRVLHGSTVLEDTLYTNRLWNTVYDMQKNSSEREGDSISIMADAATGVIGANMGITTVAATSVASAVFDFTFQLPSALLGTLASKSLPLGLMGASSLYIELELEPAIIPFVGSSTVTSIDSYSLTNIYYNAKISSLPSDVEGALIQSTGGEILLPAVSYKGELKTMATGTAFNDKFSFQYSSLKNFLFIMQSSDTASGVTSGQLKRCITSRPCWNLSEWNLMINGEPYPSQTINKPSKMYMEVLRAFDAMAHTNAGGILGKNNYFVGTGALANDVLNATVANTVQYRFVAGVDLDRFNHSSDVLLSGTNTIGQTVNLNLLFGTTIPVGMNIYGFVMYDILYQLIDGMLRAKY